ncbi:hypothetical protein CS063_11870 [Sporanaerobium hydrogeniformans]|uniref:Uncharacterized protein n=1 Tax=Sporanaerobium hydrogeniformans TaxID=3072179 RepID=A0AC61DBJ3_9FIRM|nr:glucosyltransferase domain-containing protein [Sporanaerobium hydrogeniformans]PHV70168.1 hypothetical protein CS063_11870 [Sporanaerobium hydrogeniformans]
MQKIRNKNINIPTFEDIINKINSIDTVIKLSFISSMIFFIIIHGGFFSQRLVNEDSRHMLYGWGTISNLRLGRIFGNILIYDLNSWTLGVISALYLSLASMLIVSLFRIKTKGGVIVATALMIGFPALPYMYGYLYSSHIFSRIIFLSVLAVWLTNKYKYGFIPGILAFFISIGSGQYGLSICMVVCIMTLIVEVYYEQKVDKKTLIKGIKLLVMGIFGIIGYLILLNGLLEIQDIQLASYKGFDNMGEIGINQFKNIGLTYLLFYQFFFGEKFFFVSDLQQTIYIIFFLICGAFFFKSLGTHKLKKCIILIILILTIPIAIFILDIIAPQAGTYVVSIYQMVYCLVLPIAFLETNIKTILDKILHWGIFCILVVTIFINYSLTSTNYLKQEAVNEYTMLFENRLFTRIEQYPGFTNKMPIAILSDKNISYMGINDSPFFPKIINDTGIYLKYSGLAAYPSLKTVSLMENYLGVDLVHASDEQVNLVLLSDEYKEMGTYPSAEGIKIIDGVLVVNLYDYRIDIIKNEEDEIELSLEIINDSLVDKSITTAWYVYKDGLRVPELDKWYDDSLKYIAKLEDGEYYMTCFVKSAEKRTTKTINSATFKILNGDIILQE